MTKPRILVTAPAPVEIIGENYAKLEDNGCELIIGDPAWLQPAMDHSDAIARATADCDALMSRSNRNAPISRKVLLASETLRIVVKYTIGVDDVDVDAATELGILVTHAPTQANWGGVAEGTVTALLGVLKKVREKDRYVKAGGWRNDSLSGTYVGFREEDGYPGITLGVLGLGRVGSRVSDLMKPWGIRILACDPYVPEGKFEEHGAVSVDLPTLLAESDVLTLHVTLTRETWHIIGDPEFRMMKPSAVLINTSRGSVVDEASLIRALESDLIQAAVVDVFEEEPVASDNQLKELGDKVMLSPHMISGNAGAGLSQGISWATESALQALRGEVPSHIYNAEALPLWKARFESAALI